MPTSMSLFLIVWARYYNLPICNRSVFLHFYVNSINKLINVVSALGRKLSHPNILSNLSTSNGRFFIECDLDKFDCVLPYAAKLHLRIDFPEVIPKISQL